MAQYTTTLYTRHLAKCNRKDRNYHRCGCPIWFQCNRKRWSAETSDWDEALKRAASGGVKLQTTRSISVEEAVDLYLKTLEEIEGPEQSSL